MLGFAHDLKGRRVQVTQDATHIGVKAGTNGSGYLRSTLYSNGFNVMLAGDCRPSSRS